MSIVNGRPSCYFVPRTPASYGYRCSDFREIGAASLKEKQREALLTFLSGRDMFVVLPIGYDGKSLIYVMLPLVFGHNYANKVGL